MVWKSSNKSNFLCVEGLSEAKSGSGSVRGLDNRETDLYPPHLNNKARRDLFLY